MLKAWLRRQITDHELILNTEQEVYAKLLGHFGSEAYEGEAKKKDRKISSYNITWLDEFDRKPAHSVDVDQIKGHDRGVRKLFSFWARAEGSLACRVFSCWCPACVAGTEVAAGGQIDGCERSEMWQTQTLRETTNTGIAAQRSECKKRALAICKELVAGGYCAMETADVMQAEGAEDNTRFYICRMVPWDDGSLVKEHKGKRKTIGDKYNKQPVDRGDPIVRVCYFPLDCTDKSGLAFLDSGIVSEASGLGIRRALGDGTFMKEQQGRVTRSSMSTAPAWSRWQLAIAEKANIDSKIR